MPFQAKVTGKCVICDGDISPGTVTTPVRLEMKGSLSMENNLRKEKRMMERIENTSREGQSERNMMREEDNNDNKEEKVAVKSLLPPIQWAHKECISPDDERIPICKHWKSKGVCIFKEKCQFRHPIHELNTTSRQRNRHGTWGRKRIYNEGRASALRRWILNIFGLEYLQSGSGVLDVAGGKGEVSFEILNLNGLPSTVFDPRPLDLYRYKRKLQFGFYHRNEMLECYNPIPLSSNGEDVVPRLPTHIRGFFEMYDSMKSGSLYQSISRLPLPNPDCYYPLALRSPEEFENQLELSRQTKWTKKGLQHENDDENNEDAEGNETDDFDDHSSCMSSSMQSNVRSRDMEGGIEIENYAQACDIVRNCSILVGMHPDQAVEHIIDYALLNKKPFAVVPCCVYHKQFPHRLVSTGTGGYVRRYGELIEYLLRKDSSIKALEMDFEGKNIMLYSLGNCIPLRDPTEVIPHICKGTAQSEHWWRLSNNENTKTSRCHCQESRSSKKKPENIIRDHGSIPKYRDIDEDILEEGLSGLMELQDDYN